MGQQKGSVGKSLLGKDESHESICRDQRERYPLEIASGRQFVIREKDP